jgi:hypothetical protein
MPDIKFTTKIAESIAGGPGICATSTSSSLPSFANSTNAKIRIMSGPIPTQNEIDVAYPTWDRFTGSPSEILIEFQITGGYASGNSSGEVIWDLVVASASRDGTASWWCWTGNTGYNPQDRGDAPDAPSSTWLPIIVGDVTVVGGSGSMTLVDLNIVASQNYDIGPMSMVVPRSYTYV